MCAGPMTRALCNVECARSRKNHALIALRARETAADRGAATDPSLDEPSDGITPD
jgi:hypothetical protein